MFSCNSNIHFPAAPHVKRLHKIPKRQEAVKSSQSRRITMTCQEVLILSPLKETLCAFQPSVFYLMLIISSNDFGMKLELGSNIVSSLRDS